MSRLLRLLAIGLSCAITVIHATPQVTKVNEALLASRSLQIRQESYQINPTNVPWPPSCATLDDKSCLGAAAVKSCTIEYCSKKVALTCWKHAYWIDLNCLCKSMSSTSCPSCSSGISNQLYLAWLSQNCVLAPGWNALPTDWSKALPPWNMVRVGGANGGGNYVFVNTFVNQFVPATNKYVLDGNPLDCTTNCNWWMTRWTDAASLVDGSGAASITDANLFDAKYAIGGAPQPYNLYLDLGRFCVGWSLADFQESCTSACNSGIDPTRLVIWLHKTCGTVDGFTGLPSNWNDLLVVVNSSYPALSSFDTGPSCASSNCLSTTVSKCTSTRCIIDGNGDCSSSTSAIGLDCLCSGLSSTTCAQSCSSGIDNTEFLLWLNRTCSERPAFSGLPSNWIDSLVLVNSSYPALSGFQTWPGCASSGTSANCQLKTRESGCTSTRCKIDASETCTPTSAIGLSCMCSDLDSTSCSRDCTSNVDGTSFLLWLNQTCPQVPGWAGLPTNWTDEIFVANNTFPASSSSSFNYPSCLASDNGKFADCQLNKIEARCSGIWCTNKTLDQTGSCPSEEVIPLECFCSSVQYNTTCTESCLTLEQRNDYLTWIYDTCSPVGIGTSLPDNWKSLLKVIKSDLLPWRWNLASPNPGTHCPSASSKLLAFAVVNLAMILIVPVLGRRTIINKLTFGVFGKQESQRWYLTCLLAVAFHLISNAINAAIIKHTHGYGDVSITNLTFLWCTRPRISWFIIALIRYGAEKSTYFSAAASTLASEIMLQIMGAYYIGSTANYGRIHTDYLTGNPFKNQAMILYGGAILWLVFMPFAIAACVWSIWNVDQKIGVVDEIVVSAQQDPTSTQQEVPWTRREFYFTSLTIGCLLLCWIAQWLWWAGYIDIAGDNYCPPKLPLLAFIWIIFSGLATLFGASF